MGARPQYCIERDQVLHKFPEGSRVRLKRAGADWNRIPVGSIWVMCSYKHVKYARLMCLDPMGVSEVGWEKFWEYFEAESDGAV
jgi:hypothetical protein